MGYRLLGLGTICFSIPYYLSIYFILIICNNEASLWATYIIQEIYPNNKMDRIQGKTLLINNKKQKQGKNLSKQYIMHNVHF